MQEWLARQTATGFKDLRGTQITASIHVSEALINELVAAGLNGWASPAGSEPPSPGSLAASLARFVTAASVKVGDGVIVVDVEVRV